MTVSTTPRIGVTRWSDPNDPFTRAQMDASHAAIESLAAIDVQGLLSARPAPGTVGRFYSESSGSGGLPGTTWRDDASSWRSVGSRVVAASATDTGQVVRGAPAQSANLQEWQNSAAGLLAYIDSTGKAGFPQLGVGAVPAAGIQAYIVGAGPAVVPLTVRAAASPTADLQQWQNSAGTANAAIDNAFGAFFQAGYFGVRQWNGGSLNVTAPSATTVPFAVRGATAQSAVLTQWQDPSGTVLATVNKDGALTTIASVEAKAVSLASAVNSFGYGATISAAPWYTPDLPHQTPMIAKGASGQIANLQEWQSSTGTVLAYIDPSGSMRGGAVYVGGFDVEIQPNNNGLNTVPSVYIGSISGKDATTVGTGGSLYVKDGALRYRGAGGTLTTLANS